MATVSHLLRSAILVALAAALSACSEDGNGSSDSQVQLYHLAGTVALGRPGQWANVCINDDCTRANNVGNYRLTLPLTQSQLVRAAVPEKDGKLTWLTSLYRHSTNTSDVILNLNPTTTALLDAWSRFNLGQTLDNCLQSTTCEPALISSFSANIQAVASERLGHFLAGAWKANRDPFNDLYLADPAIDWLDNLHDHFHYAATAATLDVSDAVGNAVGSVNYVDLFGNGYPTPLSKAVTDDALGVNVPKPGGTNLIVMHLDVSPGARFSAPRSIRLDASDTYSTAGSSLTFLQELVAPDGSVQRFNENNLTAPVSRPGPHSWVVTVTDDLGNRNTLGLILQVSSLDPLADPSFGAAGSCPTDPGKIDQNSINLCEEPLDGGIYGSCVPALTGATKTITSPARCSSVEQNGGALLGVCTELDIELRVFYYINPLKNSGESFDIQRTRLSDACTAAGKRWTNQPEY
ncbi:hypothetical protein [Saccharospirillum mangrovi]|uniref:hypothetical protein n=1 Tax=Saccharospirillum mangrovi TaxID=2161747 RepID=UPI000D352F43|nr:hypothetical protein [Saccharospirillum mangrovi]